MTDNRRPYKPEKQEKPWPLPWPRKALLTIAAYCAIIAAPRFIPAFYNWSFFEWETAPKVLEFKPRVSPVASLEEAQQELKPETARNYLAVRIVDPAGNMRAFYEGLWRIERKELVANVRVLHYGDSPTTADLITADVRRMLQDRFGDAGHGTYLIAKPWAWYGHEGVEWSGAGWTMQPAIQSTKSDGMYGLGGVWFRGGVGAISRLRLKRPGARRVVVSYWSELEGGDVLLEADGNPLGEVSTQGPPMPASQSFPLPEGTKEVTLRVMRGNPRLFTFGFFNETAGVVYDSLGLNGAATTVLASVFNEMHWAEVLRQAAPQLVIINYGTNESVYPKYVDTAMEKELRRAVKRVQDALPGTSILIMSPMDRGERQAGGIIGTVAAIPRLVALQERVARDMGVAFFNTFESMGGTGTMGRWYEAEPRLVSADFIHPLPNGARMVGKRFYEALMEGYNRYKLSVIRAQGVTP